LKNGSLLTAALAIVLIAVAVGISGCTSPPKTEKVEVKVPISLVDAAKEERELVIYGAVDTPDFEKTIKPEFLKLYPWAKISYIGLSPGEISTRIISEYKANKVSADIVINTLGSIMPVKQAGAFEKVENRMTALMAYPEGTYDPEGYWHPSYGIPIVVIYNTKVVKPEELPKTWEDLADPKWKGKIAIDNPSTLNVAATMFAHLYGSLGEEKAEKIVKGIAENDPILTQAASDTFNLVSGGDAYIGIGLLNDYISAKEKGGPVEVVWLTPAASLPVPIAVTKNAPHPNMAKLFLEWWTSSSGQMAIAKTGRTPMHPAIASYTFAGYIPSGISLEAAGWNNPDYYQNPSKWSEKFSGIFR